jgi:hypothetical protein
MKMTHRIFLVPIVILALSGCTYVSQGVLVDADRHAQIVTNDPFGDYVERIVYPDQNWDSADSLWFYNTTQGSNLMPYAVFLHLEQADSEELFRADANINRLRYLPQKPSLSNPDGLPVGWVKDNHQGKDYVGLTCAACHTGQVNFQGVGIRIDGGPAMADMDAMLVELALALAATTENPAKFERLAQRVLGHGYDKEKDSFYAELVAFSQQLYNYNRINAPMHGELRVDYGYARLDAFGRIYNRVLAHLTPGEENFNSANAPVSYPQLWDTPQHDFVQWNGVGDNELAGPLGRNAGEAIGVFASMDLDRKKRDIGYRSSVVVRNLNRLEVHLEDLWSPSWEELAEQKILPPINRELAEKGFFVYLEYQCHTCHEAINRTDPDRRVVAQFASLNTIGTDPLMAHNALHYKGRSGFFEGKRPLKPSLKPFGPITPALPAVSEATAGVILEPDHDKTFVRRWAEKTYDLFTSMSENPIKHTKRLEDFQIVDKDDPRTLAVYKARPLNGIWATAPYLHNGSVATLYELFMPSCSDAQIASGQRCRANQFTVGARELDPVRVGFVQPDPQQYPNLFVFDTRLPGNSNKGHEYAAGVTPVFTFDGRGNLVKDADGKPVMTRLPPITDEKRTALVEYLKTL